MPANPKQRLRIDVTVTIHTSQAFEYVPKDVVPTSDIVTFEQHRYTVGLELDGTETESVAELALEEALAEAMTERHDKEERDHDKEERDKWAKEQNQPLYGSKEWLKIMYGDLWP